MVSISINRDWVLSKTLPKGVLDKVPDDREAAIDQFGRVVTDENAFRAFMDQIKEGYIARQASIIRNAMLRDGGVIDETAEQHIQELAVKKSYDFLYGFPIRTLSQLLEIGHEFALGQGYEGDNRTLESALLPLVLAKVIDRIKEMHDVDVKLQAGRPGIDSITQQHKTEVRIPEVDADGRFTGDVLDINPNSYGASDKINAARAALAEHSVRMVLNDEEVLNAKQRIESALQELRQLFQSSAPVDVTEGTGAAVVPVDINSDEVPFDTKAPVLAVPEGAIGMLYDASNQIADYDTILFGDGSSANVDVDILTSSYSASMLGQLSRSIIDAANTSAEELSRNFEAIKVA
ncbi:hypothetical protein GC177_02310 [bacterium]|nr:hypothetical protein [bacterium]